LHQNAKQVAVNWNRPGWLPDGDQLAYTRADGRGLEITNLKTGEVRSLTGPAKDPTWSPNGEHIVFVRGQYPRSEETLWIMPASGGQARLLAKGGFPSWSADSRRVYYQAYQEQMIAVVDAHDAAPKPQYILPIQGWYPAVSADEKYVAYAHSNVLKVFELASGKLVHTWTAPEPQRGMIVGWSPDGRELSVTGYPQTTLGLWILELDNKIMRQVFGGPISTAIWSPDGSLLSVNVGRAYSEIRLWVIPLRPGHSTAATLLSMSAAKLPGNEHK
jgi:Tol biopolymer transport system component